MCVRPCFAALNGLPPEVIKIILEYLDVASKKNARLVSWFFHQTFELSQKIIFKEWRFWRMSPEKLRQFSDDVKTVTGIEIRELTGKSKAVDASIEYLVLNHPELKAVDLGKLNCTDKALKVILSESDIVDIRVSNCGITGENLQLETGITLALKVLHLRDCWALTSQGLKNILEHLDKEKLKELNLSRTKVSLEELNSEVSTFPNLEIIRLNQCSNITDIGLISFLNKSGAKLKTIHISSTRITLSEVGLLSTTLNSLEELNVSSCQGMTDKGLISFLNKAGGNLKKLVLSHTKITLSKVGLLTTSFPRLEEIDLEYSFDISQACLITLLSKTAKDLYLNIDGTSLSSYRIKARYPDIYVEFNE